MNAAQLYEIIRPFGYTTSGQSKELADAIEAALATPRQTEDGGLSAAKCASCNGAGVVGTPGAPCPFCRGALASTFAPKEPAAQCGVPEAEPVAWIRKTDITELTDSEPETNGWTALYAAPTGASK